MPKYKNLVKRGLPVRREAFCQEFVKDWNGTQAAIRAKYSEKTARQIAADLLSNIDIQNRIADLAKEIASRNGITSDRILKELAMLGFARIDDYVEIEEGGNVRLKTFDEIPDDKIGAIKTIKGDRVIREIVSKDGHEEMIVHDKTRYELHDKIRPLIKLGEYTKLFDTELPPGSMPQSVHNEFKIMIMSVNGDKVKEIDFSKMIETGKRQVNEAKP